jgi:ABC-type phosphate transport system ATPase subunit
LRYDFNRLNGLIKTFKMRGTANYHGQDLFSSQIDPLGFPASKLGMDTSQIRFQNQLHDVALWARRCLAEIIRRARYPDLS